MLIFWDGEFVVCARCGYELNFLRVGNIVGELAVRVLLFKLTCSLRSPLAVKYFSAAR